MSNADQSDYWNNDGGQRWADATEHLDKMLAHFNDLVIETLKPTAGQSVLDIGCGTGPLTQALAASVGETGRVVGLDISKLLIDLAQERAGAAYPHLSFLVADAAAKKFDAPFDAIASRFGVMFFDEPVGAFENIRQNIREGGRLTFASWLGPKENEWVSVPMAATLKHVAEKPAGAFDPDAPGPFGLSTAEKIDRVLTQSGWREISVTEWRGEMTMPGASPTETAQFMIEMGPASRLMRDESLDIDKDAVFAELEAQLTKRADADGVVRLGAAAWIVEAKA